MRTTDAAQGNILILGVDMAGDRSMRDYRLQGDDEVVADPLVFLAQPDSLIVSGDFASRNNLTEDDSISLVTALGTRTFTVRGIMAPREWPGLSAVTWASWTFTRPSSSSAGDGRSTGSTWRSRRV